MVVIVVVVVAETHRKAKEFANEENGMLIISTKENIKRTSLQHISQCHLNSDVLSESNHHCHCFASALGNNLHFITKILSSKENYKATVLKNKYEDEFFSPWESNSIKYLSTNLKKKIIMNKYSNVGGACLHTYITEQFDEKKTEITDDLNPKNELLFDVCQKKKKKRDLQNIVNTEKRLQRSFTDDSFPKYQISFRLHRTSKAKQVNFCYIVLIIQKDFNQATSIMSIKNYQRKIRRNIYLSLQNCFANCRRNYVCLRYGIDHCTVLDEMILAVINLCWWLNQYGQSKEKSTSGRKPEKDIQLLPVLILKNTQYIFTGASKPLNSELFTHLGGKANQPKCTSKLSLKKTKTDTDKHRFTETKSKENISENKTGFGEVIDITSPQKEKEIITSPVFKKTNTNIKTCDKEPTVIPETQYFISPVTPTCKSRGDNKTVNSPSDDLLIIPDTPEDSTSEFGKKRKNFSRSFLIGSSSLGRRPGQKITPDHSKKTKKILQKKKNLISVSVNFNQSSEKLHSETSITKEEDSTNDYTEKSPEKFTDFCEDPNESFKEKEEKELQSPEKISEDSVKDTENLWHVDIDSDNSKNSENAEGDTPVKFNDSNSKFKRMSKPGLSPAAKKVNSQSNLDTADESDTTMTETKSPELEKEKVKRVLSLGVSNKRKLKSSNTSKLNAYQMSMNISNKKKNATDIKHVNLEDDDVLGEILQELKQTPKSTIVVSKGKSSKSPSVFTKNKDSLSSNRHKSLDHFDQSLTEEEMNYFSELDNQLHTKCITEENTSKQVVKEYPLLAYVKGTKYPEKTKNPTKKKKELSDKKGLNLAPDNKNLDKIV
ncbi:hypothetical protein KUTeg_010667 [Tegillarca granosa]|uniref:Uncharacterized protein n=1 Tax=Tegillarca granosa TaxID=220873 RepID=A0ABQ9F6F4_TEGGR|nr:hypothetical protein KUTeg_010667 [Tegillarca granosa]